MEGVVFTPAVASNGGVADGGVERRALNTNRVFVGVEYPGYVVNQDAAIASLGGMRAIEKSVANTTVPLEMSLRPGDPQSHGPKTRVRDDAKLLLRVTTPRGQPKGASFATDIVGVIHKSFRFDNPADFQFIPSTMLRDPSSVHMLGSRLDLLPPMFARQRLQQYRFDDNTLITKELRHVAADGPMRRKTREFSVRIVEGQETEIPPALTATELAELPESAKVFQKLFDQRPMWTSEGVRNHVLFTDIPEFYRMLRKVAYRFGNGPWGRVWVRRGFNPLLPSEKETAVRLQCIDFRTSHHTDAQVRLPRPLASHGDKEHLARKRVRSKRTILPNPNPGKSHIFEDVHQLKHASCFFLLADITAPAVKAIVDAIVPTETLTKFGWIDEATFRQIRDLMLNKPARTATANRGGEALRGVYAPRFREPQVNEADAGSEGLHGAGEEHHPQTTDGAEHMDHDADDHPYEPPDTDMERGMYTDVGESDGYELLDEDSDNESVEGDDD